MARKIKTVAVLGAGVMGAQIAAHLSNAGIKSYLFDVDQETAEKGVALALKLKPAAFYNPKTENMITRCNYEDHLEHIRKVDWVIEAIVERLDIKRKVFKQIVPFLSDHTIVSSNTSGISMADLLKDFSANFKKRFLITHFFNPPRYMKLLEIVRGTETDDDVVQTIAKFCENELGKGIVYGKDTANFIANRIGIYGMMVTMKLTRDMNLTIEEVDKLTGTIIGRQKSATYRTADIVGLDTLAHVVNTSYEKCPDDSERELFKVPDYLVKMLENKWLGQKTKCGFYKKVDKDILSLDFNSLEHKPQKKVLFDGYRVAKSMTTVPEKIRALTYTSDKSGQFSWELTANVLIYAANRIPEIADDVVSIDNAMKWGFGWGLGPFETWDAIGVEKSVRRMESEGRKIPEKIKDMLKAGGTSFYKKENGRVYFFDFSDMHYVPIRKSPKKIELAGLKRGGKVVAKSWSASLVNIGDDVACLEFHSVLQPEFNPIDGSIISMLHRSLRLVPEKGFKGLVIGNQAPHFSAGANLALILGLAEAKEWQVLGGVSKAFQDVCQALKYAPFPVVAAPFNLCLGGGYEIAAATDKIVAAAELYCGAVEVGVGLIPGAGGNLRVLSNWIKSLAPTVPGPFPAAQKAFETIGFGKVSFSAKEAVKLGYLTRNDEIVVNADHVIYRAKKVVEEFAKDYHAPEHLDEIYLPGLHGRLVFESTIDNFVKSGVISDHDAKIGKKLAYVLTGGEKGGPLKPVNEQYLLDLEREAFVSLAGEKLSQDRMAYMLKKGKPLRN